MTTTQSTRNPKHHSLIRSSCATPHKTADLPALSTGSGDTAASSSLALSPKMASIVCLGPGAGTCVSSRDLTASNWLRCICWAWKNIPIRFRVSRFCWCWVRLSVTLIEEVELGVLMWDRGLLVSERSRSKRSSEASIAGGGATVTAARLGSPGGVACSPLKVRISSWFVALASPRIVFPWLGLLCEVLRDVIQVQSEFLLVGIRLAFVRRSDALELAVY